MMALSYPTEAPMCFLTTKIVCGFSLRTLRTSSRSSSRTSSRSKLTGSTLRTTAGGQEMSRLGNRSSVDAGGTGDSSNSVVINHPMAPPQLGIRTAIVEQEGPLYDDRLGFSRGVEERDSHDRRRHLVADRFDRDLEIQHGAHDMMWRRDRRQGDELLEHR